MSASSPRSRTSSMIARTARVDVLGDLALAPRAAPRSALRNRGSAVSRRIAIEALRRGRGAARAASTRPARDRSAAPPALHREPDRRAAGEIEHHVAGRRVARLEADGQELQHRVAGVAVDADRLHLFDAREMQRRAAALVVALPPRAAGRRSPRRSGSSPSDEVLLARQPVDVLDLAGRRPAHARRGWRGPPRRARSGEGGRRPAWLVRRRS